MITFCRAIISSCVISGALFFNSPANALHGTSITIRPNDQTEVVIAFDPEDASEAASRYLLSPYGLMRDVLDAAVANEEAFRSVDASVTIFLDVGPGGDLLYSASRQRNEQWEIVEQQSFGEPAGSRFVYDVICGELLAIECKARSSARSAGEEPLVFDKRSLYNETSLPFVSLGSFPPSGDPDLNIYTDETAKSTAVSAEEARVGRSLGAAPADNARILGDVGEAIDAYSRNREIESKPEVDPSNIEYPSESEVPFENEARSTTVRVRPGYDPRLRYITIHCTAGVLPESTIDGYASSGKRNKGQGYIMLDGRYKKVRSIAENPNVTYATKTETCLRREAFGTMFNIELNYKCHWRPELSESPSEPMLDRLADVIIWIHQNVGNLGIIAHTYVDMGLRDGHTDPQDNPRFDWNSLYARIERRGGNLNGIHKIDPAFAAQWPISRTDRAHQFPPIIAGNLSSGKDECGTYAGD